MEAPPLQPDTPQTPAEWVEAIMAKAQTLGFQSVGILNAEELRQDRFFKARTENLSSWLEAGYQGEMAWMANHHERRIDPASLMEGCKSIVCVAMNYYNEDAYDAQDPNRLKIAKYARGSDYHDVVKSRLKKLLAWIQSIDASVVGRALTDSAPILEKPLAQMAGIGWQGKNGNVISAQYGSFFFLGELLLSLDLPTTLNEEKNLNGSCGTCTRCIEACPTDAILTINPSSGLRPPSPSRGEGNSLYGVVDATKCISYWTIEYKGDAFPKQIQENLDGWIFGCDICQDVCPWNLKFAAQTTEPLFQSRPWNISPDADDILSINEEIFKERYRKSPIKRTKISGLQRNVKAAISPARKVSDFPQEKLT